MPLISQEHVLHNTSSTGLFGCASISCNRIGLKFNDMYFMHFMIANFNFWSSLSWNNTDQYEYFVLKVRLKRFICYHFNKKRQTSVYKFRGECIHWVIFYLVCRTAMIFYECRRAVRLTQGITHSLVKSPSVGWSSSLELIF